MIKEGRTITCIVCPKGCSLELRQDDEGAWLVSGNECEKGEAHALEEILAPKRVLATTVALDGGVLSLLPVRSSDAIPRDKLFECMVLLSGVNVNSPVEMGCVVVKDILGLGIDIISTRSVYEGP